MRLERVNAHGGGLAGYSFRCPGCGREHYVPTVGPHAWGFNGDEERPTFTPSILVYASQRWEDGKAIPTPRCHSFVRDGRIEFCGDSEHALAGKTVDLPEVTNPR